MTPIRVGVISNSVANWPLLIAHHNGLFTEEQLDVDVQVTGSSANHLLQLERGDLEIGHQVADHIIRAVDSGSDLVIFMGISKPVLSLVVEPAIASFQDLRSKTLAVDGTATGFALLLIRMMEENGLKSGDYELRPTGNSQKRFEALTSGEATGALLDSPLDLKALDNGYKTLAKTADYFPRVQGPVAATRRKWAEQNSRTLIGYVRAYVRALSWLANPHHEIEAASILAATLSIPPSVARQLYQDHVLKGGTFCSNGEVEPEALRNLMRILGMPDADLVDISRYLNLTFRQTALDTLKLS
jgi:ABC-type nitrate/sulfonate/bicarbonate transport system substrate-binding protein